jgi:hypothetical protein
MKASESPMAATVGRVERVARRAAADPRDGLAKGDDHHARVAVDEVARVHLEAALAPEEGGGHEGRDRGGHEEPAPRGVDEAGRDGKEGGAEVEGRKPQHGLRDRGAALHPERDQVQHDHVEVREPERQAVAAKDAGDCRADDEEPAHRRDQHNPHALVGARHIREPHIAGVHPPDQDEDEQRPHEVERALRDFHEQRELRDCKHEDELEEELDIRDAHHLRGLCGFVVHGRASGYSVDELLGRYHDALGCFEHFLGIARRDGGIVVLHDVLFIEKPAQLLDQGILSRESCFAQQI